MKRREFLWFAAGIFIGSIYLSEQSQFGDTAVKFFSASREAITTMLERGGEGARDIGQAAKE